MATLIMKKDGEKGGVFNDGDIVSGGAGKQTLLLFTDGTLGTAKNIVVDTTIERVDVQAKAADMKLTYNATTGNIDIMVGTTVVASVQAQPDTDGTQIATADGSFFLKMDIGVDGNIVGTISNGLPGSTPTSFTSDYVPQTADIDVSQKSEISGGGVTPPTPGEGETFILTEKIDNIQGTSANDIILASQNITGTSTLNPGDQINGGAGTDTLKLYGDTATNFSAGTISSVEIVENYTGAAIDVSGNADVQEVWAMKASGNATTATVKQKIGFSDVAGNATAVATFKDVAGATDSATLAFKDAGKTAAYTSITVAGIEQLTLEANGKNQLGNMVAAAATDVIITGSGSLKAAFVPGSSVLKNVDATGNTGGVDLTLTDAQFGSNSVKVSTGLGDDKITFSDAFGAKATIDLGAGNNSLTITQGSTALTTGSTFKAGAGTSDTLILDTTTTAITATTGKMFTGFENLVLKGASSYHVGDIAGIVGYEIASGAATAATITGLSNDANIKISASSSAAQVLDLQDNSSAGSSVNVILDNGQAGKAAAAGVSTLINTNAHVLDIVSSGNVITTANTVSLVGATNSLAQLTNITISGDQATKLTTAAATALTLIDGSSASGKLEIVATSATKSMMIKGGTADDTITASDESGVVSTIIGGTGADTITLGATAGNSQGDIIRLTAQADSTAAAFDKITNFVDGTSASGANADKIDLTVFGFTGTQADTFAQSAVAITGTGAAATFSIESANATGFFTDSGVKKAVALHTTSNETFVFIDADKDGNWNADTDSVVLLVGDYSTDKIVDANFTFA